MSFTKSKYDNCSLNQQQQSNNGIFSYVVDNLMYVNKNECNNYTPPFLTYIPSGVAAKSVDIENELKGINRPYSKCTDCKYNPEKDKVSNVEPKKECEKEHNILPNGYLPRFSAPSPSFK